MRYIIPIMSLLIFLPSVSMAQSTTENYVMTETMLDATGETSVKAVQYYNGLGFPTLSVATTGGNGETAYTLTTYDGLGREDRKYVPVPGSNLDYISESSIRSKGYYYQDNSGFTQNHYDALDRVLAVDIAGDKWRQAGKQNRTEYLANTEEDKVLHYEAHTNSNTLAVPSNPKMYYPAGSLTKEISIDADDKKVETYKNLFGDVILQRVNGNMDTYYVYDEIGHLRFVLSPSYQKNGNTAISCYEYRYDDRGRVVWKKLPGAEYVQYWYDDADRVVCAQDAVMRKSENNKFRFTVYDKLGRVAIQGLCSNYTHRAGLATVTYKEGASGFLGTGYEIPSSLSSALKNPELEIVNYYDNYNFVGNSLTSAMPTINITEEQKTYAIGFQTGAVVYATNGEALGSISVYDQKGQVVKSVRKGLKGFIENVNTAYTHTGAIDNTEANVDVKYGSDFTAKTVYTYQYGKKKNMALSVSHGGTAQTRETEYVYDAIGRLSSKNRQLNSTNKSYCTYSYDVHGWLTSLSSGEFRENLYYADGLDGGCYNGNISTIKWKERNGNMYQGYNLKYDNNNRLINAVFGTGDNLTSTRNYFNESVEYDCNGNITRLLRNGLVDKMHGGFGLVDNLSMTYEGNLLTSVCDNASHQSYAGATDFDGVAGKEYPLTYNDAGSLTSDAGRKIARIDYDCRNNPVRIQFTNGNVTKYVYSATGEKLRVIYQTAVPNITVAIGSCKELTPSEIQYKDSTDYLLGGALTLKNGRIDKFQFEEGYCQASKYKTTQDNFTFCYYDQDHLGNIRQVTRAVGSKGTVIQAMNYYPFGAQFCDGSAANNSDVQSHKYNGKELDLMHGLNTYDYGARQYNPVTGRWDRVDPHSESYRNVSPFVYCNNTPMNATDPDGKDWYWDTDHTLQYNPNVHSAKDMQKGQEYVGATYSNKYASFRKDGSILFNNETKAYNRMWDQANRHYRTTTGKSRENGGFILSDGRVLVLPDYKNDSQTTKIEEYGYFIGNGTITCGQESFSVLAQIHTHQDKTGDATPSYYGAGNDSKLAAKMKIPVFVLGHNNNVYGIVSNSTQYSIFKLPGAFNKVNSFLRTNSSFAKYIKNNNWKL